MGNPIKDFFTKKKNDIKFKKAGTGQKLGDSAAAASNDAARARQLAAEQHARAANVPGAHRAGPTEAQRQAAEAAQARMASSSGRQTSEEWEKKRSQAAIRAQAQKQLEAERAAAEEAAKLKERYGEKPVLQLDAPSACPGVFFHCPLIGPEVLPKADMRARIKEFLYEQLEGEDKGLTACLVIHTLTADAEKVNTAVAVLGKYIDNILGNPSEEKFRRIRKSNRAFAEKVAAVEGTTPFLEALGFESCDVDGEAFWVFPDVDDASLDNLQMLKEALVAAEPIRAELDRAVRVLEPGRAKERFSLPQDFFSVSAEEIKREQQAKAELVESQGMLRTKAMREKEAAKERRRYRYTLIRIRFPNGIVLQGTFSVYEPYRAVHDFLAESLETPLPFVLYDGSRRLETTDYDTQLADLCLVPSALLTFNWHPEVAEEVAQQLGDKPVYLKEELMQMLG